MKTMEEAWAHYRDNVIKPLADDDVISAIDLLGVEIGFYAGAAMMLAQSLALQSAGLSGSLSVYEQATVIDAWTREMTEHSAGAGERLSAMIVSEGR